MFVYLDRPIGTCTRFRGIKFDPPPLTNQIKVQSWCHLIDHVHPSPIQTISRWSVAESVIWGETDSGGTGKYL